MLPWTGLVWNLISHIPPVPSLEVSHAINIRPISMKFTRSTLNDPKYTHTKNHINRKRLPYEFWYRTKTAITFGEECISGVLMCQTKCYIAIGSLFLYNKIVNRRSSYTNSVCSKNQTIGTLRWLKKWEWFKHISYSSAYKLWSALKLYMNLHTIHTINTALC